MTTIHLNDANIRCVRKVRELHDEGCIRLRADASTHVEAASDWYDEYGAHISTEDAGDITIHAIDYDWLDESDDDVIYDEHYDEIDDLMTRDEALELIALARSVRESAETVEGSLEAVVEAYEADDLDGVIEALEIASDIETDHGDDPATEDLMRRLLDVVDDVVDDETA